MNRQIKIYVATHKKITKINLKTPYTPIMVGAVLASDDFDYLRDDKEMNISKKNKNYCELTAMYWIWKNDNSDVVGLVHYRRYFMNLFERIVYHPMSSNKINKIMNNYDMILPVRSVMLHSTVYSQYKDNHYIKDLDICREIIKNDFPDYIDAFDSTMKEHEYYEYNMLICKKKYYNQYMEWLFKILFKAEKQIDISEYSDYDKRVFGFLSERLFNVWIKKNSNIKIKKISVYNIDKSIFHHQLLHFKDFIKKIILLDKTSNNQ